MRFKISKVLAIVFLFATCTILWIFSNNESLNNLRKDAVEKYTLMHRQANPAQTKNGALYDASLLEKILKHNSQVQIANIDKFDITPNHVIIVQVHNRPEYLNALINSLRSVRGIENCLVIFSHDFFNEHINSLVEAVDFVRVAQIFFPFSNQIWERTFPGQSSRDCPRNLSHKKAIKSKCLNALHPDSFGHYRESSITQIKHHWWWKINYVFEHLQYLQNHDFELALIEEDHYLLPDFLHIWKLMRQMQADQKADLITLGNYGQHLSRLDLQTLQLATWHSTEHNMGFVVDRAFWAILKTHSKEFCSYDDYNWDWTLHHLFTNVLNKQVTTLVLTFPRTVHIGTCGQHTKKGECSPNNQVQLLESLFVQRRQSFFPKELKISSRNLRKKKPPLNGGWGDVRDHQLCLQYHLPDVQILRQNRQFSSLLNFKS